MENDDTIQQNTPQHACFLCTLDPRHTCHQAQLTGHLIAVHELTHQNTHTPILLLDTGTEHVEILLDEHYYRTLIKEIQARSTAIRQHHLKVHVYHLPTAPVEIAYKKNMRLRYAGNQYTMAVIEPDILLNITDLNQAEYCSRQYLLRRMIPSPASAATIRGNLIHYCFKELLKEHSRSRSSVSEQGIPQEIQTEHKPFQIMERHLQQALQLQRLDIALADVSFEEMRTDVAPHLESLANWYQEERNTLWSTLPTAVHADDQEETPGDAMAEQQVRAETFLLAPEIGLRGRLDLFWKQPEQQRLLELKTGNTNGNLPKGDHRWQVLGYHALLAVRRHPRMKRARATLLYSGTQGKAQAYGIPATIRDIQRVNDRRNMLVLSRITAIPPAPPGPHRCSKCSMLDHCQEVSALLHWQPPEPETQSASTADESTTNSQKTDVSVARAISKEDQEFFARHYQLLQLEGQAGEQQQAQLWNTPVTERIATGRAIQGLEQQGEPQIVEDGWSISFRCTNTSELREGDEILVSDGDPITGEVVSGTITAISSEGLIVWTRELIAHPQLIDRYDNDLVHVRTLQNLMRWQHTEPHIRDLVAGRVRPRFIAEPFVPRSDFNDEQNLAVERALQMKDYLLIQGPPGTGKTSVIAEIVKRIIARGERVMLAAFTNQAVDNMLKRIAKEDTGAFLRLGSERSVDESVKDYLLKAHLLHDEATKTEMARSVAPAEDNNLVFDLLHRTPVVASTTATWSSDRYAPQSSLHARDVLENNNFIFDVAIIDEAGQLTIPAILGALRFARRFILVGDEKQLPPLVLSQAAAQEGLSDSLFGYLKQLDDDYQKSHPLGISACVALRTQYRMNKWISNFASKVFYDDRLVAAPAIANQRITYPQPLSTLGQSREHPAITRGLDPRYPLVFLDVPHPALSETTTKISHAEAELVREVVAGLLTRGIQPQDIGIIAPYRAQVAHIRRQLFQDDPEHGWQALATDTRLSVDTVDRFQGGERQVMIISFATHQEPPVDSPLRTFLTNPNRLNVALTRAQRKLILIGSEAAINNLPVFTRLIAYCQSMHTLFPYDPQHSSRETTKNAFSFYP